jgi:hypothetical protein
MTESYTSTGNYNTPNGKNLLGFNGSTKLIDNYSVVDTVVYSLSSSIPDYIKNTDQYINKFITNTSYYLLYRGSVNGFNSTTFHNICNNVGPTLTIIKLANGTILAGYTSLVWNNNTEYAGNGSAFLYNITNDVYFTFENKSYNIYRNPGYGPTFGGGHDMYIQLSNLSESYVYGQHSYTNPNGKNLLGLAGTTKLTDTYAIVDVEVWE